MHRDSKTGIVMATLLEARSFQKGLDLKIVEKKPFKIYQNRDIALIISGIGKASCAMASAYLITRYNTEILYNLGAAGATTNDRKVGEIYHIDSIIEFDRPKIIGKGPRFIRPDVLDGFTMATLSTQDRPVIKEDERASISSSADLLDMEGAAFVQACRLFGRESYLFKIVSDTPEHKTDFEIIYNIKKSSGKLFDFFVSNVISA